MSTLHEPNNIQYYALRKKRKLSSIKTHSPVKMANVNHSAPSGVATLPGPTSRLAQSNETLDRTVFVNDPSSSSSSPTSAPVIASSSAEMCSSPRSPHPHQPQLEPHHHNHNHHHHHHHLVSAKVDHHPQQIVTSSPSPWRRGRRRPSSASTSSGPVGFGLRALAPTQSHHLVSLSLLVLLLVQLFSSSQARHYIAPGPCTWTHVSPFVSRDIRLKSSSHLSASSSSSSSSSLSSGPLTSDLLSVASSSNDFDVSLRCSVSALTPFTLNLSLIEPEHTVKLAIGCFGGDLNSADRSTLRQDRASGLAPFEHLRSLNTLSIEDCKFDRLPADSFRGLMALKNLTIRSAIYSLNEPFMVEAESFRHVENHLENLDLGSNQIATLPADLFCPFVNLRTLNLTGNSLFDLISFGLIDPATGRLCLQELQQLDLSYNQLELVPETSGVAALRNLQVLNISSNHIREIAELAFSALRRLYVLDISGNRLRTLPGRMFRDSDELKELRMANNGLAELPAGLFKLLSKLLVLDISGNQLTSETLTGETFADLIRVVVLDLSNNRLRRLSASTFQNQYSLQVLSLEGNDLETIEEGAFSTLYNLHTLRLARNRLRHLPDSVLSGLFVLHQLALSHNQLEHVHDDAFKNCSNLQNLDISDNRLTTLPTAIRSLRSLRALNFAGNKLVSLTEPGPLVHTTNLASLDLSNNYLVNVTRNSFRPVANTLEVLRLDGNRLRSLEKNTLEDLRRTLRHLRLDRNEFTDVSNTLADLKNLDRLESLNVSQNAISWFDYIIVPSGLRVLDLSHNRIEQLGNYYELQAQLRLEDFDVSHNLIREIAAASIPHSIRTLNLRSNRIEKVDQFAFVAKHNVTFVDIRNNSLRRIDNNAFRLGVQRPTSNYFLNRPSESGEFDSKYLPPPIFLIAGNPYYCDCTMEWLQRVNQLVGGVTGSGAISTYPRIGDLEQVKCELPFTRQASSVAALAVAVPPLDEAAIRPPPMQISLLTANSSNFLCRYRTHCFTLCHCCEFDACDCEMMCPENCTCYYDQTWNTNIVDCSAANYRAVPARIPMDVTSLYLDGNQLYNLNAHTFIGRKNLRVLHLNHSNIETIANRSFNGLVYLEELHLENNQLAALNGFEFEALHYLTTLHLEHNRITFIHEKTFSSLRSLQLLRLDHNQLTSFGLWFSPAGLLGSSFDSASLPSSQAHSRYLSTSLSSNPWSCEQCPSMATLYDTLRVISPQLHISDAYDVRCLLPNQSGVNLLRNLKEIEGTVLDRCNLSSHILPTTSPSTVEVRPPYHPSVAISESSQPITTPDGGLNVIPPRPDNENANSGENSQENGSDIDFLHIDKFMPKQPPSSIFHPTESVLPDLGSRSDMDPRNVQPQVTNTNSWGHWFGENLVMLLVLLAVALVISSIAFVSIKRKQDIQLWFYGRYGVRLFETGLCGCRGGADARTRRGNGFNDNFVRDSEKLFDAFVIYARPDESFVTQQLAAELECGYPPYRLCLRYRDLPAPSVSNSTDGTANGVPTSKDHGYAFDAVTQAIECSRRTLVVISEAFLQSDWCKFELKAAHQETLSSCKTHRLIVVIVPSATPQQYHHQAQPVTKMAELLVQRLDTETKACIRGVTVLTWGERRFWEKLRFSMPPSSTQPVCSGESIKGRTSTVVVTNSGYPTLAPSSLSSSSSLARSSVLYDTQHPIYYQQHHYHYAQLPPSSNASLHKSSSLSIFGSKQPLQPSNTLGPASNHHQAINNNNHMATLNHHHHGSSRNPFSSKPLPPPPNQPLPPLPLVSSHFGHNQQVHINGGGHHQLHGHSDSTPPTYATCSEYGGEYETTAESIASSLNANNQNSQVVVNHHNTMHHGRTRAGLTGTHHPQFYHSSRRAPM